MVKMMFEVCRSLAVDKTNLFFDCSFLHATGLVLVLFEEGDSYKEKKKTTLTKEVTKVRTSILAFNTRITQYLNVWSVLACQQALQDSLAARWEAQGELATTSLEFEYLH